MLVGARREGGTSASGVSGVGGVSGLGGSGVRVRVAGLAGWVPATVTLAQLVASVPHSYGPHVALTMHVNDGGIHLYLPSIIKLTLQNQL